MSVSYLEGSILSSRRLIDQERNVRFTRAFGYPTEVIAERFWAKVEKTDTCWLWTGMTKGGYGRMQVKPRGGGLFMPAHRIAYQLLVGPIEKDMTIDHTCAVKLCVNPEHMEQVPMMENLRRQQVRRPLVKECRKCGGPIAAIYILCRSCWQAIPVESKAEINEALEPGLPVYLQTSAAYWQALDKAIGR